MRLKFWDSVVHLTNLHNSSTFFSTLDVETGYEAHQSFYQTGTEDKAAGM
jgi:hypothetical protein